MSRLDPLRYLRDQIIDRIGRSYLRLVICDGLFPTLMQEGGSSSASQEQHALRRRWNIDYRISIQTSNAVINRDACVLRD